MKKKLYILLATLFCFALIAWGISTYRVAQNKQFSYLPAYNSDMKATANSSPNAAGLCTGTYTVKNATKAEVFQNYENILKKGGWTITQEQKPNNLAAKKDKHQVTLITMQNNKDVDIIIMSK